MEDFNEGMSGKLASTMRKRNPDQFYTMVKMHLSFVLELNTAEENDTVEDKAKLKKWSGFLKKPKSITNLNKGSEVMFLTDEGINQFIQLVNHLSDEDCITQEGIFRRTGSYIRQQELKTALNQGLPLNLEKFSVHDCASVLKALLSDLSEPLLTDQEYSTYCQIAELINSNVDETRILTSLRLLLLQLPLPNRIVFKQVVSLLHKTAKHEKNNKMNCDTLATLFTPHLLCSKKISPEALHTYVQNLSPLVAFMIKKGLELFDIPEKLSTDIRVFLVEQDKQLLSPDKTLNESSADTAGTVHTVYSFVDHHLTAKATAAQDTEAALAQLYAHIRQMPESAKKRRLIKQFNKENGQGTPRQFKQNSSSGKSFGDSIKKRIFQKKLLSHKNKIIDVKLGCNFSRSSSEENMISNTLETTTSLLPKMFSKSEDELSDIESYEVHKHNQKNLLKAKHISNSTGSINTSSLPSYKKKGKVILKSFLNLSERSFSNNSSSSDDKNVKKKKVSVKSPPRYSRHQSEPPDMYSCYENRSKEGELMRQTSDPSMTVTTKTVVDSASKETTSVEQPQQQQLQQQSQTIGSDSKSNTESTAFLLSPATKSKLKYLYAHSTPSNLPRKSITTNDYVLTPITDDDKSMSPITQSTSKMPRSMQETMMTPRSRKPVIMVSASNLCGLATLDNGSIQYDLTNSLQASNFHIVNKNNCISTETSPNLSSDCIGRTSTALDNKENIMKNPETPDDYSYVTCIDDAYGSTIQKSTTMSISNTFQQYFPSRSVLTASPVDLSFTSRTGDFEQSESDLNVLAEEGNSPSSDTSGVTSSSTNSMNNSTEKVDEAISSPRKRCASLQRNDSKRSFKDESICEKFRTNKVLKQKQLSESALGPINVKESLPETSF